MTTVLALALAGTALTTASAAGPLGRSRLAGRVVAIAGYATFMAAAWLFAAHYVR